MTHKADSKWAVVLTQDVSVSMPLYGVSQYFYCGEQLLGKLSAGGVLTICKGYACDGYSPTLRIMGRWVKFTPTPRAGLFPAVLHDFTRQFLPVSGCLWTIKDTDTWFYNALVEGGVSKHVAGCYYSAVSGAIGTIWARLTRGHDPSVQIVTYQ